MALDSPKIHLLFHAVLFALGLLFLNDLLNVFGDSLILLHIAKEPQRMTVLAHLRINQD